MGAHAEGDERSKHFMNRHWIGSLFMYGLSVCEESGKIQSVIDACYVYSLQHSSSKAEVRF